MGATTRLLVVHIAIMISACSAARKQQMTQPILPTTSPIPPTVSPPPPRPSATTMTDLLPMPGLDVCEVPITSPLGRLRMAMKNTSYTQMNAFFDAFLIFFSDEHLSEEPQEDERRLEYISGWDGAGTGVVMENSAALWVPSGEVRRARAVVGCPWTVVDQDDPSQPTIAEWITDKLGRNGRVGGDARLTSVGEWTTLHASLQQVGLTLIPMPTLIDQLWADEPDLNRRRPEFSRIVAQLHHADYTACSAARKQQMTQPIPTPTSPLPPTISPQSPRPSATTMTDLLPMPGLDVCDVPITSPLGRLRMAMKNTSYTQMNAFFDAFLIFFSDEHLSEEPQEDERRLQYISGWDGAGTGVVMENSAALWVPSGEVQRARAVVGCPWTVVDQDDPSQPTIAEWITDKLGRNGRVGGDARLTSVGEWTTLHASLQQVGLTLIPMPTLIDQLWADEPDLNRRRPEFSRIVAQLHHGDYTGLSWREKVVLVRNELKAAGADAMIVTSLDEVAWLLNVRGRDTPHAPLLKAFVIVSLREVRVYAPPGKLSMPVREALAVYNCFNSNYNCTKVNEYTTIYSDLRRITESKVLIPTAGTFQRGASAAISQAIPLAKRLFLPSPIIYLKAQKNEAEIKGMKRAHLKDAVAMCTLLNYLETIGKSGLTELSIVTKVDATRATQAGFNGKSMMTRVAFGPNAAVPEYRPTNVTNRRIFSNSTLVIQSGGQYVEGTTIVTRTLHYGFPTKEIRRAYTTVLRSLAAIAMLKIPATLPAAHTDPVARAPLWGFNQDYLHPTGHGVGAALNRREDPVVIDYRQDTNLHTFREGYFITNEPAWYESGKFGVRLGNVLEVVSKPDGYLAFVETTLVPFDHKLIDRNALTDYEVKWLNAYNERIRSIVGPELMAQGMLDVYYWMTNNTKPYSTKDSMNQKPNSAARIAHIIPQTLFSVVLVALATL